MRFRFYFLLVITSVKTFGHGRQAVYSALGLRPLGCIRTSDTAVGRLLLAITCDEHQILW